MLSTAANQVCKRWKENAMSDETNEPTEDIDDVEGHTVRPRATEDDDDVEGHTVRPR